MGFKVKTTTPRKYVVRPSSGVADPGATVQIQVVMQSQKDFPPDLKNCKDKFLVQTVVLQPGEVRFQVACNGISVFSRSHVEVIKMYDSWLMALQTEIA